MTQYEIDNRSGFSELLQAIRNILLSYPDITEVRNAKQTSYHDSYGVVLMVRSKGDTFVLAFGKGAKLQEQYPTLVGNGKIVRHLYLKSLAQLDESLLRALIEESLILNMEAYEMKLLRASL